VLNLVATKPSRQHKEVPMNDSTSPVSFPLLARKEICAQFDGGEMTSDAGLLFLAQADRKLRLTEQLAEEIWDPRDQSRVTHSIQDLLRERIFALCAGYEDANDLDTLKSDPALLLACGKNVGEGEALASQPTISRLENSISSKDLLNLGKALARVVIGQLPPTTRHVILDVDATADPCHGQQELELFNGYYDAHCYLPLLLHVTAEDGRQRLVSALLRPGTAGASVGLFGMLKRVIAHLRARFPQIGITLRADGGFGNADVLAFCEQQKLSYVLGVPGNKRLKALSAPIAEAVSAQEARLCEDTIAYTTLSYKASKWHCKHTLACKAETVRGKLNVRYVVHDRKDESAEATYLFYCGRGDQENRIKELKLDLFSGRTSCHRFFANQFRLLLSAAAYVLFTVLQEALAESCWAGAQIGTLRLRLIKIGARVVRSCRRIRLHLPTSSPSQRLWRYLHQKLLPAST
jgi:hypothetical protein